MDPSKSKALFATTTAVCAAALYARCARSHAPPSDVQKAIAAAAALLGTLGLSLAAIAMRQPLRARRKKEETWQDFRIGSDVEHDFEPRVASGPSASGGGGGAQQHHYVLHSHAGLESLAATEVKDMGDASTQVVQLFGKVLFQSTASLDALRALRSAEDLSLLCWASPVSAALLGAPNANGAQPASQTTAASALADDFAAFYAALDPIAAAWLRRLEELLRNRALPALEALVPTWRSAVGLEGNGRGARERLGFRVTVKRSGKETTAPGVTSVSMEQLLGGLIVERLGWRVDLKRPELNVVMQWCEAQATLELPLRRHTPRELPSAEALRPWLPAGALRGPVSWSLLRLALEELALDEARGTCAAARDGAGLVILDPCVGRGGLLVEAALSCPQSHSLIGVDDDVSQLSAAAAAARRAGVASRLTLVHGDCTHLPLADGSVDIVCVDLPFGKTHKAKATTLSQLYELAVGEAARVCRPGGVLVALSTHKHLLSRMVRTDGRWEPLSRHELSFGGLTASAISARRRRHHQ